jgi:hypothetical protein
LLREDYPFEWKGGKKDHSDDIKKLSIQPQQKIYRETLKMKVPVC